jgi:clan AA aspartic protease (TIGR02281 family)
MRQSSRTGSRSSIRARRMRLAIWAFAGLSALPTGCLETGSALAALSSDLSSVTPPSENTPDSSARATRRVLPDSPQIKTDQSLPSIFSDEYWSALADLDLAASRIIARGEPEVRFADAVALLAAGDYEQATNAFTVASKQTTDLAVAVASQAMLAATLMHEHKWQVLRDLSVTWQVGSVDQPNVSELELWGKAFAGLDPQVIDFPREPVSLRLGSSALGTPTIRVRINGRDYQFWLDTGSTITVLSSTVAAKAGIVSLNEETLRVGTFAGIALARPAVLKRVEIGSIVITNSPAMVMDASLMWIKGSAEGAPWGGFSIDGIIGWDIIRRFAISMDFAGGTITLRQPENLGTRGTSTQNLTWIGRPIVQVRTTLGETVHFTLDTGAQSTFVSDAIVRKLGVATTNRDARVFGIGSTEGQSVRLVRTFRLDVGGKPLVMRDLIVYNSLSSGLVEPDGILGSNVGRFGTVTIDATNGLFSIGD